MNIPNNIPFEKPKNPFAPKMRFRYNDDDDEPLTFRNLQRHNELLKSEQEPLDAELLRIKYVNQLKKEFRSNLQSSR